MNVAISWANKKQLAKCAYMVDFPISSHIYNLPHKLLATIGQIDGICQMGPRYTRLTELVPLQGWIL